MLSLNKDREIEKQRSEAVKEKKIYFLLLFQTPTVVAKAVIEVKLPVMNCLDPISGSHLHVLAAATQLG